jgi:soluble lytic murein transglycosylase-like protein
MVSLLITFYSLVNGIDPSVSFQIARVESNMNVNAVSKTNDGGLFQLNAKCTKNPPMNIKIFISHFTTST